MALLFWRPLAPELLSARRKADCKKQKCALGQSRSTETHPETGEIADIEPDRIDRLEKAAAG